MASVAVPGGALVTALVGVLVTESIGASVMTSATTFRYPMAHFGGCLWPNGLASVTGTAYTGELLIVFLFSFFFSFTLDNLGGDAIPPSRIRDPHEKNK
jgi:CBS-domain-containing membrane protein